MTEIAAPLATLVNTCQHVAEWAIPLTLAILVVQFAWKTLRG